MNWIIAGTAMFCASVAMYLLVRYLQQEKLNNDLITYFLGAMPAPVLFIYILAAGSSIQ
jgi:hypothetical protein